MLRIKCSDCERYMHPDVIGHGDGNTMETYYCPTCDDEPSLIADVLLPMMDDDYRDLVNSEMAIFEDGI